MEPNQTATVTGALEIIRAGLNDPDVSINQGLSMAMGGLGTLMLDLCPEFGDTQECAILLQGVAMAAVIQQRAKVPRDIWFDTLLKDISRVHDVLTYLGTLDKQGNLKTTKAPDPSAN